MVAVHSHNNKNSSMTSSSSSSTDYNDHQTTEASRLRLLHLLLETAYAFLHTPSCVSDAVPDAAADSEAWVVATMDRETLVAAGMGEAVVLVADGLLAIPQSKQQQVHMTMTTMTRNDEAVPLRLLALCCRVVALLAGPAPSSSDSSRSSRFLYPPTAATRQQQHQHHCCDDDVPGEEELVATVNVAPTLSSLGLLVTPTPTSIPQPRWKGVPWGHRMGLEPFSTRLFQTDLRKTLSLQTAAGSAIAAAHRLRASGCCETIVQVTDNDDVHYLSRRVLPSFPMYVTLYLCHAFTCMYQPVMETCCVV